MNSDDEEMQEAGVMAVDPQIGHPYLEFPNGTTARRKCNKLRRMVVGGHVAIDWPLLEELGEAERARDIIGVDTPWTWLFAQNAEASYRELTIEFLSTFTLAQPPEGYVEDPAAPFRSVRFRLAGQLYVMTMEEFAVHSGLYTVPELQTDLYTEGVVELPRSTLISF